MALCLQINDHDLYHLAPEKLDQLYRIVPKVPLIRIYGALRIRDTRDYGFPILVHVHNYYPYLYVDCLERNESDLTPEYLQKVTKHIEEKIHESFQRRRQEDSDSESETEPIDASELPRRFVASVAFCRGTPVYGYHLGYSVVLKILLLLPLYKTRLARLIELRDVDFSSFSKSKRKPNVYEAHIPYLSQFLADFNLYGCGWLEVDKAHFRLPLTTNHPQMEALKKGLVPLLAHNNILNPARYPRMGRSVLEIDILAEHITNRNKLQQRNVHNDFTEFNRLSSPEEIYLSSLKFTFDDLKYQCNIRDVNDTSQLLHSLYTQIFKKIGMRGYSEWETSPRFRELLPYVEKLNRATGIENANEYYDKVIRPSLRGHEFPTCYEHVDQFKVLDFFQKVPLLNFRDDLIRWSSLEALLALLGPVTPHVELKVNKKPLFTQSTPQPDPVSSSDEAPPQVEQEHEIESSQELVDSSELPPLLDANNTSLPKSSIESIGHMDHHLFTMTQRKRTHSQDDMPPLDSIGSLLSQTLHAMLRNPQYVWELTIPASLRKQNIMKTLRMGALMDIEYSDPAYFEKKDIHTRPLVFSNRRIIVPYNGEDTLKEFIVDDSVSLQYTSEESKDILSAGRKQYWQYAKPPPSRNEILHWLNFTEKNQIYKRSRFRSQIEPAVTQTKDFKYSYRSEKVARNPSGFLNLTQFHMELHVNTSSELKPNPKDDPVSVIFYSFDDSNNMHSGSTELAAALVFLNGVDELIVRGQLLSASTLLDMQIKCFTSEKDMVNELLRLIEEFDPDILSGYEINAASWGYLVERFQEAYDTNLLPKLSRATYKSNGKFGDRWGYTHTSALRVNGRHMLNIWRLLRSELRLTSYTLENVSYHLRHQPLPRILNRDLSKWFRETGVSKVVMFFRYYKHRLEMVLKIVEIQEMILRNVEQSRLIGVDFNSNFYRGSQFMVESILLRIAKEENMLLNSPTKTEVHDMRALDCIPLILEPDSGFYKSPLVVLDFQSLYPSIMIAYNYCYSTLLGKIEGFQQNKNGVGYLKHVKLPSGIIEILDKNDGLNISPNGLMFVSSKFRKSILSRMLQEILNMRINVKSVASEFRDDVELAKLYNSKQLALKLIANVTYGYASASFSGRMPSSDIADAIVGTGREILTKSIELIESGPYNAKVVYGDTDSLFVYFPGRSKADAFKYGKEIAESVTEFFPDPIKLKFEKVYHPCVLLAKKRYVGNCFEFEDQKEPTFEAKGIETIRRDGIPAQLKMVGKALRILFGTKNLSKVKEYVLGQFFKILFRKVNVKDFCFAKEVRHGTYKNEKYLPPGAVIAQQQIKKDPRREPQYRERVPYLVIRDATKERIKDRCVTPEDFVMSYGTDNPMELDFEYYITRVLIPPLERVFNLMGLNIKEWYRDMPKTTKHPSLAKRDIINQSEFVQSKQCYNCESTLDAGSSRYLCSDCLKHELDLVTDMVLLLKEKESNVVSYNEVCILCSVKNFGNASRIEYAEKCINGDCHVYYAKGKATREFEHISNEQQTVMEDLQW